MVSFAKPGTKSVKLQISIDKTDEELSLKYVIWQLDTPVIKKLSFYELLTILVFISQIFHLFLTNSTTVFLCKLFRQKYAKHHLCCKENAILS